MKTRLPCPPPCARFIGGCLLACLAWTGGLPLRAAPASGTNGVVATGHALATAAALAAMTNGGNAIDGAVAAALTLGVVDGHNSGLGGGCFMVIRLPRGGLELLDGRETAPLAAQADLFVRDGKADTRLSQTGALAAGVPGALAVYDRALRLHGRIPLREHLLRAARIAEEGFRIDARYARLLAAHAGELNQFPTSKAIFVKADGTAWAEGDLLQQPDLGATYRALAMQGVDWFYRGPFAERTARWMKANGGLMTLEDFRKYQVKARPPIYTRYRGHQVVGFPLPSSGGVLVAEVLNILETFDLAKLKPDSAEFVHLVTEAMKLAFADRAHWLGDPAFAPVPRGLTDKDYARQLAQRIRPDRATAVPTHGQPPRADQDVFGRHTTHFSTADREGHWVACTATLNTSFGAKVVVPGTGVLLNNQMDDFSAQPGATNYFGLVGAAANAVGPGKRPLSSMSPTLVLFDGRPVLCVGAAGGPTIISQTLLAVLYTVDFGLSVEEALARPRFHHQWRPDELRIERGFGEETLRRLAEFGHKVAPVDSLGAAQAVGFEGKSGRLTGAADPRGAGEAAAF